MDNLETLEVRMIQDIDEYVNSVDSFENALNARNTLWHERKLKSKNNNKNRKAVINLIASLAIAGAAVFLTWQLIV